MLQLVAKIKLALFRDNNLWCKPSRIHFRIKTKGEDISWVFHQRADKPNSFNQIDVCFQGDICLPIGVNGWKVVGNSRENFVPLNIDRIVDTFDMKGLTVGVDDISPISNRGVTPSCGSILNVCRLTSGGSK